MKNKFARQNVLDVRHGKVELRDTEARLSSLQASQSRLSQELHNAQSSQSDLFKVGLLRLNLLEVNDCIDSASLELASRNKDKR